MQKTIIILYPSLRKSFSPLVECVEIPFNSADFWTIAQQIQLDAVNIACLTVLDRLPSKPLANVTSGGDVNVSSI
jgi:hypothetical protein